MKELQAIYDTIQSIKKSDVSDFEKMVKIHEEEKKASAETWNIKKDYSLSAQNLYDYAQSQWSDIYLETDKASQLKFKEVLDKEFEDGKKWSIR